MWLDRLPASVAFCDVETTGLGHHDRIVSFGGIGMISRDLAKGRPDLEYLYLVFDPGMSNYHDAERIHGFSDSALRLQDLVRSSCCREMRLSGLPALTRPVYCTMKGYRALALGGSASLSAVCRHIKLARSGDLHDAIEDAWLAVQIYLRLHGCPLQRQLRGSLPRTPSNLRHAEIGSYRVDRQGSQSCGAPLLRQNVRHHGRPASRPKAASAERAMRFL